MTSSTIDDRHEPRARGTMGARARSRAACAAALLLGAVGACSKRTPTQTGSTPAEAGHASQPAAGARPPSPEPPISVPPNPTPPGASAAAVAARSTRSQMLSHYADTVVMRRALVAGQLAEVQAAAAAVARDEWAASASPRQRELTQLVRSRAADAESARSLPAAARALGALGEVCAACHVASGALQPPLAPEAPSAASDPSMLAHAVASERLWAGLTLPSDESWASGVQLLLDDPGLAPSAEVASAARLLKELARRGARAEPGGRGDVFADVLATCSGCHERLGVVLEGGAVPR